MYAHNQRIQITPKTHSLNVPQLNLGRINTYKVIVITPTTTLIYLITSSHRLTSTTLFYIIFRVDNKIPTTLR